MSKKINESWTHFHDRVSNALTDGNGNIIGVVASQSNGGEMTLLDPESDNEIFPYTRPTCVMDEDGNDVLDLLAKKVDKVSGKGLSTNDFTTALKTKLEGLSNYDDTEVRGLITAVSNALDTLTGTGNTTEAIDTMNEIMAFLNNYKNTDNLSSVLSTLQTTIQQWVENKKYLTQHQDISGKVDNTAAGVNGALTKLPDWTATPTDTTKLLRRDTGGNASFGQVTFSTVWEYIKGKISSILGLTATSYGGNAATATKVGTSTVGAANKPIYIKSGVPTACEEIIAENDVNGVPFTTKIGKHRTNLGNPTMFEAATIPWEFVNQLAFMPKSNVVYETSSDGESWSEFAITDAQHKSLWGGTGVTSIPIPKDTVFRFTVTSRGYCYLNMLYLYASSNGGTHNIKIEGYNKATETWSQLSYNENVSLGWPGHNVMRHTSVAYSTGTATNYRSMVRVTIDSATLGEATKYPNWYLYKIEWYGGYPFANPYHYSVNGDKETTFPSKVTATSFAKSGGTSSQFLKADGSVDSNTYETQSHASSTYQPKGNYLTTHQDISGKLDKADMVAATAQQIYNLFNE